MKRSLQNLSRIIKNSSYLLGFLCFLFLLQSCNLINRRKGENEDKGKIIAKVHDLYLYESDLQGIITRPVAKDDSIRIIKEFIDNWVKEQLVFKKALKNLSKGEKNKDKELKDYYKALITYAYESKVVEQRLNKDISEEEINEYYENNKEIFTLDKCLIQARFLKIPADAPDQKAVTRWFTSKKDADYDLLLQYCMGNAIMFNLDEKKWFYYDEINAIIPLDINCDQITANKMIEYADSSHIYLLQIEGYKPRGSASPKEFVHENIINAILHKRRLSLINEVHKQIFEEGVSRNYYKIYE